jgi:hypothetical protein
MANNQMNNSIDNLGNVLYVHYNIVLFEMDDSSKIHNLNLETEMECSICYNSTKKINSAKFECNHEFCIECTEQLIQKKHADCPYCRNKMDKITCYNEDNYNRLRQSTLV